MLKRILFPSLSIYFFSHFCTFFPIFPHDTSKSGLGDGQKWAKMGSEPPGIPLKYYNHTNEHILSEYYNYVLNLFKNHKFGFPIKTTIYTENLLYNIKEIDNNNEIDITNITNYQNYFDTNSVTVKNIYKVILQFIGYYNDKKIEMVNIYNTIQDISKELKFNTVFKLFKSKFINN